MKRRDFFFAGLLACSFIFGSLAFAEEPVEIAVDDGNPPFMYGKDGKANGLYPDILREVFKKVGVAVTVKSYPWKRALDLGKSGSAGVGGIYKNAEREKIYDYSDAMYSEKLIIYVKKGAKIQFNSVADLKGKAIGVLAGWSYGDAFDDAKKNNLFKVEEVTGDAANFKKLANGRLDCVVSIELAAKTAIAETGTQGQVEALDKPLDVKDTYLVFAKSANKKALLTKFNTTVKAMQQDGSLAKIIQAAK